MRLIQVICRFSVLIAVITAVAAVTASAITIQSPTEGQIVRDQVKIVVPRASLAPEVASTGFLVVKIDGRFIAAVGLSSTDGKAYSDSIVYIWKSKEPINDPTLSAEDRYFKDGKHEIAVEGFGPNESGKYVSLETAKVSINLQNKVPQTNPPAPIKLRYTFRIGQENIFRFTTYADILSPAGVSLSGGQYPIQGQFSVLQAIEDLQSGGTAALARYKVDKNGFTQLYGNVNMIAYTGTPLKSVYKIVNNTGRTLEDNVLSQTVEATVTDTLVWLPSRLVQVGETWPCTFKLKLEGLCDLTDFTGTSTLEGLEWEQGYKCAKIVSKVRGLPNFKFLEEQENTGLQNMPYGQVVNQITAPYATALSWAEGTDTSGGAAGASGMSVVKKKKPKIAGPIDATITSYFAYETGKLIKNIITMEFQSTLAAETIAGLQQRVNVSGGNIPSLMTGGESYTMPSGPGIYGTAPLGPSSYPTSATPTSSLATPGSGGITGIGSGMGFDDTDTSQQSIKVRLTVIQELIK